MGLCRRSLRDRRVDVAGAARTKGRAATVAVGRDPWARHAGQDATAGPARALARFPGRDRAVGAAQAGHVGAAGRRLRAAGENRGAALGDKDAQEIELIWSGPLAAVSRSVRLAGRPRRQAGDRAIRCRSGRPCWRMPSKRRTSPGLDPAAVHRRMEMGWHPRAGGGRPRRKWTQRRAALFAHGRGHFEELSRSDRSAAPSRRDRRRASGRARRPRAIVQCPATAAQPQNRHAEIIDRVSRASARL